MDRQEGKKPGPLFLIDGYALIYRSYFAFINRPIMDPEGRNISAVFGFFRTLFTLIKNYEPARLLVAMDSISPTFRHDQFDDYKATRQKTPEELTAQIPRIEEILQAAGVACVREEGLEADDIIATIARTCSREGRLCTVVSGDKDLMQLVDGRVTMLRPVKGEYIVFDPDMVFDHFGVHPDQIVDYLALIGDSADNIPGVKGIGPKGAVDLLSTWGTLDGIYEHLPELSASLQRKLEESRDLAYMSRDLATLRENAECVDIDHRELSLKAIDWSKAIPYFSAIRSSSLVRLAGEFSGGGQADLPVVSDAGGVETTSGAPSGGGSVDMRRKGSYRTVTTMEELRKVVDAAERAGRFAFDLETDSTDDMVAVPAGFSLSMEFGKAFYVPLVAGGQVMLDPDAVRTELKRILEAPACMIIGQNFKYDYKVLRRWGIRPARVGFDTMIAAWLLDSSAMSLNMDSLARKYLDYETITFSEVVPKGSLFPDIPLDDASKYAAEDADVTFRLYTCFAPLLRQQGLEKVFQEVEMPLVRILAEMELQGMALKVDELVAYGDELRQRIGEIERTIFEVCGREFNIGSTKQLQEILFQVRGLKPVKKTKTGYSTDTSVLEELASQDIVPSLILQHRSLEKLRNTYVDALPALIDPVTGKLHTSLVQTGTATGRLSSRNPNLQNIPIKSEDGRRIRSAFVPSPGMKFLSADYAQIELVVLAHFASDQALSEAFRMGRDVHRHTGALIFGVPAEEVTPEQRRIAKTINFGVMYGMSAFRLSRELGIPRSDAERFITSYFTRYAGIQRFISETIRDAEQTGQVSTLLGHVRKVSGITSRNRTEKAAAERIAVNTPIQGSAADIMKLAMIAVTRRIDEESLKSRLILQVHDELIFEVVPEEEQQLRILVQEEMEQAVSLDVPLHVSIETGMSWGDLH